MGPLPYTRVHVFWHTHNPLNKKKKLKLSVQLWAHHFSAAWVCQPEKGGVLQSRGGLLKVKLRWSQHGSELTQWCVRYYCTSSAPLTSGFSTKRMLEISPWLISGQLIFTFQLELFHELLHCKITSHTVLQTKHRLRTKHRIYHTKDWCLQLWKC